ncbi:MAG TPA: hypothetical protein DCZ51_06155 [Bacteroidales bacterium]|jgi:hypothetical protein|nr:hypothetical protein [Bacteroidales bacterium]
MPAALTSNSPGVARGKGTKQAPHPARGGLQLEVNPSGIVYLWDAFYPGCDPGYWKMTPLVSFLVDNAMWLE